MAIYKASRSLKLYFVLSVSQRLSLSPLHLRKRATTCLIANRSTDQKLSLFHLCYVQGNCYVPNPVFHLVAKYFDSTSHNFVSPTNEANPRSPPRFNKVHPTPFCNRYPDINPHIRVGYSPRLLYPLARAKERRCSISRQQSQPITRTRES